MFIVFVLLIFACVIVALSGNHSDAEQLYYDADFTELYSTEGGDKGRKFKGGEIYNPDAEGETEPNSTPSAGGEDVSLAQYARGTLASEADADAIAAELYHGFKD